MSSSPPYVQPSRRLKRRLHRWVADTRDLLQELETSGLVVNHGNREDVPPEIRDRSTLISGAFIELTHGMLVLVGAVIGKEGPADVR